MVVIVEESDGGSKRKLKKALKKMKKKLNEGKEVEQELNKVWQKIIRDAKSMCPKDTGALARTIRTSKLPIGSAAGKFTKTKEYTIFDRSIIAGDLLKMNPKSKGPVDYAVWVHDGHRMRDGRMHSGTPFLAEALAMNEEALMKAIDKALKKIGKEYERE